MLELPSNRRRTALAIAILADALQIVFFPVFVEGIPRFAELYVRGLLAGGSYDLIPLVVNAYILGGRYESNPAQQFLLADEVRRWITEGRF